MRTKCLAVIAFAAFAAGCASDDGGDSSGMPAVGSPTAAGSSVIETRAGAPVSADDVAVFAREKGPDTFAGVAVDGEAVVVHRIPDEALDDALDSRFPTTLLRFVDAARSERELDAVTQEILRERTEWERQGLRVDGVGPDFVRGKVVVRSRDVDTASRLLGARYGDVIVVESGAVVPATVTSTP